jgi:hypothetical protein
MPGDSNRVLWHRYRTTGHGVFTEIISAPELDADAVVMASITELAVVNGREVPHFGNAHMSILNVSPRSNEVLVRAHVAWGSPLLVRISLMWINT